MEDKIRQELYDKLENEYNNFIDELKTLPPEKIIDKSYEKVMKEETLSMFIPESKMFDMEELKALNKEKNPLEYLYQGWMNSDLNINQLYEDNVRDSLYDLVEEQKNKAKENRKKDKER